MSDYSLSDIAAASGEGFGGNGFFWIFALLLLPLLSGGGMWGGRQATSDDIQRGFDTQDINGQLRGITNGISDLGYALDNKVEGAKDYISAGIGSVKDYCVDINRNVDSVRFDMSNYAAQINANTTAQTQKVLDLIQQNKIDALQAQVNQLQMQNAMCGVVKYPNQSTYYAGANPFCAGAIGCNC